MASDASLQKKLDTALARADSAEQEALEQARLNGMGSEREALLLGKIGRFEKALLRANGNGGLLDQLQTLVRNAYNEGFSEGMNEFQKAVHGGKPWPESNARERFDAVVAQRKKTFFDIELAEPDNSDTPGHE